MRNAVDLVLVVALAFAAARGFRQGALSQVAAFGGACFGLFVGAVIAPRLAANFVPEPGASLALLTLSLLLVIILAGQGIGVALGNRLRGFAAGVGAGALDRTAGIVVGVVGLLLTVWLLASVLVQGPSRSVAQQIRDSMIVSVVGQALPPPPDVFGRVGSYLDRQGFPQVVSGLGAGIAPPIADPSGSAVVAAQRAGGPSTVQVLGLGCGGVSSGSGFVTEPGFVVTNAHVVAGTEDLTVRDATGEHRAVPVHVNPDLDVAVLAVPRVTAPPLAWAPEPASRGGEGATLGFPGGRRQMVVRPAAVRGRGPAVGRDIYGRGLVTRDVLTLSAGVQRGDSGGPFVTADGRVAGVVFAAAAAEAGTAYALTAEQVRNEIDGAISASRRVGTGSCRF